MKHTLSILTILITFTSCAQTAGDFLFQEKASGIGFVPHYLTPSDTNLLGFDGSGGITSYPWPEARPDMKTILWVSAEGNDATGERGNPGKPYATFQAAIDDAMDMDEVRGIGMVYMGDATTIPAKSITINAPYGGFADLNVEAGGYAIVNAFYANAIDVASSGFLAFHCTGSVGSVSNAGVLELYGGAYTDYSGTGSLALFSARIGDVQINTALNAGIYAYNSTINGNLTLYDDEPFVTLDRATITGGITNAAFTEIPVTAYNVVTTNDTAGQMLDITGRGNCFGCTDGGGPVDTPALTDVLGEGNATAGKNIVITSGDSIDFLHSTYIGRLTKATLTNNHQWALPNGSGYLARTNSSTGAISYLDVSGLGPMATSSNPSDLAQEGATDGQVLTWDNTAGEWVPETPSGGGGTPTLSDVLTEGNSAGSTMIEFDGDGPGIRWVDGANTLDVTAAPSGTQMIYFPAASGTVVLENRSYTSSNFTTTSGSLVSVTGASMYLEANTTYNYEIQCEWASSNNAGTILASVYLDGGTVTGYRKNGRADGTMNAGGINGNDSGAASGTCVTAGTRLHLSIEGKATTGGMAEDLYLRVASNSGYTLTIYEGCSVEVTKVK